MTFRQRLDALEERAPARVSGIRAERDRRVKAIQEMLAAADQPDASPAERARGTRVREILELARQRMEREERAREPWRSEEGL